MTQQQRQFFDNLVMKVCDKYQWELPETWCYPGDLIFEVASEALFICGSDPKDVAELRRRGVSNKKVDVEALRKFLISNSKGV